MAQKRVAITGYTGFIGTHLMEEMLRRGHIVHPIGRDFKPVDCDMIYHLACPSTTKYINEHPQDIMDIIMDGTRNAIKVCPGAMFINASSYGATAIDKTPQGAYNVAKRCMEIYLEHAIGPFGYINYRIPSVYGPGAPADSFVQRCMDKNAEEPKDPEKLHYIVHVSDLVEALAECKQIPTEEITLGQIYEQFTTGRRGLHRPASRT
jgi:nucleoside-diphosphate-sugar epimerase